MRFHPVLSVLLLGTACSGGSDVILGTRVDGVHVACEPTSDDVSTCTPDDGGGTCDQDGAAIVLWPPNHKLVQFTLADCAPVRTGCGDDGGGDGSGGGDGGGGGSGDGGVIFYTATVPTDASITSITSDEAVDATGDGHTADDDVAILDDVTFAVRSERAGSGDGRVYHVNYATPTGELGACDFIVPHDQGPAHGAVDSGVAVTVTR